MKRAGNRKFSYLDAWKILGIVIFLVGIFGVILYRTSAMPGWREDENGRYYVSSKDHQRVYGPYAVEGVTYVFDADGYLAKGFVEWKGYTFYADAEGKAQVGLQTIDGKTYCFDREGAHMIKGFFTAQDDQTYYFGKDGAAVTSWMVIDGKKYYFDKDGRMATEMHQIDGKIYFFGPDGVLIENDGT